MCRAFRATFRFERVPLVFVAVLAGVLACGGEGSEAPKGGGGGAIVPIMAVDFSEAELGPYTIAGLNSDWNHPLWSDGVEEGSLSVVEGAEAYQGGRSLRILYRSGQYGSGESGGGIWDVQFGSDGALASYDELYAAYRVKFDAGFDFVKEGKMHGLAGGARNSAGTRPNGSDGFSVRLIWEVGGRLEEYVYHPDQVGQYGDELDWVLDGSPVYFEPGVWYWIEHRVKMNTPGQHDGIIQCWLDGRLAFDRQDFRFRDLNTFGIDAFQFSTFFGGGDSSYAATKDEYVTNDDFVVSESRITH
jgi:hypothetical protein